MRGKLYRSYDLAEDSRNIPAYAGKTGGGPGFRWCPAEHPRVCGENLKWVVSGVMVSGTSPRMRGKHGLGRLGVYAYRNIPAYAGKTTVSSSRCATPQEHPRVCGENRLARAREDAAAGTSPRMRGKPCQQSD